MNIYRFRSNLSLAQNIIRLYYIKISRESWYNNSGPTDRTYMYINIVEMEDSFTLFVNLKTFCKFIFV